MKLNLTEGEEKSLKGTLATSRSKIALPELDDVPTHGGESCAYLLITLLIAIDLGLPESGTGLRHYKQVARLTIGCDMSVPKTAIDKNDGA